MRVHRPGGERRVLLGNLSHFLNHGSHAAGQLSARHPSMQISGLSRKEQHCAETSPSLAPDRRNCSAIGRVPISRIHWSLPPLPHTLQFPVLSTYILHLLQNCKVLVDCNVLLNVNCKVLVNCNVCWMSTVRFLLIAMFCWMSTVRFLWTAVFCWMSTVRFLWTAMFCWMSTVRFLWTAMFCWMST
jgi:hypothetical protein